MVGVLLFTVVTVVGDAAIEESPCMGGDSPLYK